MDISIGARPAPFQASPGRLAPCAPSRPRAPCAPLTVRLAPSRPHACAIGDGTDASWMPAPCARGFRMHRSRIRTSGRAPQVMRPMAGWVPCRAQGARSEARADDSMDVSRPAMRPATGRRTYHRQSNAPAENSIRTPLKNPSGPDSQSQPPTRTVVSMVRESPAPDGALTGAYHSHQHHCRAQGETLRNAGRTMWGAPVQGTRRCGQGRRA